MPLRHRPDMAGEQEAREYRPVLMLSKPGVTRDGTLLARDTYSEFQWCRSYQGRPRKMGGYRRLVGSVPGIIRSFNTQALNSFTYIHSGSQDYYQQFTINNVTGEPSSMVDRTPTADFTGSELNNWQQSVLWDTSSDINLIMAHAATNILDISDDAEFPVFYGHVEASDNLVSIAASNVSGGCVALVNYLVIYGNDGVVKWSVQNNPTNLTGTGSGSGRPCANKIVRGLPLRGSGGPAALLWSLDSVIIMQWVGGSTIFDFDTITTSGSILSSNGVIENNGIYYWATTNGFSMFNGVIRDVPNDFNKQWFLENLNWTYRQKVFAYKVPRWNEIWWCFPFGDSTEPDYAVIYNYAENCWYDTQLPADKRSAGDYAKVYPFPIMSCTGSGNGYSNIWQMETGTDRVVGETSVSIPSWFETHEFNYIEPGGLGQVGANRAMSVTMLEPDFEQSEDLSLTIKSRQNARAPVNEVGPVNIAATYDVAEETMGLKTTGRLMRYKIMSDAVGGNYVAGSPLLHVAPADKRMKS